MWNFPKNEVVRIPGYHKVLRASSLARNIAEVYSGDVLSKIIAVGTAILLIRGLSIRDYTAYIVFHSVLFVTPGLVGSGINLGLVRFSAEYLSRKKKRASELYVVSFIFQLILYTVFCFFLFMFANEVNTLLFGDKMFGSSLRLGLVGGLGLLLTQAGRSIYQAEERFGHYVRTLLARQVFYLVAILVLFLLKDLDFQSAAKAIVAVELCIGFAITFYIFKDFSFKQAGVFLGKKVDIIKDFFFSTGWLIAYFFTLTIFQRLDIFMLSHLSTVEELSNYGVAFRYYSLALLLLGSIHAVLLPRFSKVDMEDLGRQRRFTFSWLKATGWLIVPIAVADAFGKPLFVWISGSQYETAFYIFVVFSVGVWLSLIFSPLVNILMRRRAFKFLFASAVGGLLLNFTGNYFLIPIWGGLGAGVVTILSNNVLIQGLILFKVHRGVRRDV